MIDQLKSIVNFWFILGLLIFLFLFSGCEVERFIVLEPGMTISQSGKVKPGVYYLPANDSLDPVITISGENIELDFTDVLVVGDTNSQRPDLFKGLGILVEEGHHIQLKGLRLKGYKVGILADSIDHFQLLDSDLSYNYRPRLWSIREREMLSDWLSYHINEADEWLRYGMAVYLKHCDHAQVRALRVTGCQNGLMLYNCNDGTFYNNTLHFNSGLGIGMYRSSRNRIMHNRLDWNVRGYSHGIYQRGQDSAGILCYEQSSNNIFAFNSATHSGDGFFLWAGDSSMDSGEGGCNGNLIYQNDFSYAPTNGIEVTFSSNNIINNRLNHCRYGVWGGYSFNTLIANNEISNNDFGIAIEHGNQNTIVGNSLSENAIGIQLWERPVQPAGWGFAEKRNVSSRNYTISANNFNAVEEPLMISKTDSLTIQKNYFRNYNTLWPNRSDNTSIKYFDNEEEPKETLTWKQPSIPDSFMINPLPDGMDALLPASHPQGKSYILMNEWGPYNFTYPSIWLRSIEDNQYVFLLMGPREGNWRLEGGYGFEQVVPKSGTFPTTLVATKEQDANDLLIKASFIGPEIINQFGDTVARGEPVPFQFARYEQSLNWKINWYNYSEKLNPITDYSGFQELLQGNPAGSTQIDSLGYRWWGSPANGVQADRFATEAITTADFGKGAYTIQLTCDDGAKLYIDGQLIWEDWQIHESATHRIPVELIGIHTIRIEHFDNGGLASLDFHIERKLD